MTQGPPSPERIARFRAFTLGWLLLSFLTIFSCAQLRGWRQSRQRRLDLVPGVV